MDTPTARAANLPEGARNTRSDLLGRLVALISESDSLAVPELARECATHALLDWTCVALAGMSEPAVQILLQVHAVQLPGAGKLPPFDLQQGMLSALISGTAGHALDYDDVNSRMHGHPSVPVIPAALAAARSAQATGRELLDAIVVGHEVEALIGEQYGGAHYRTGFHATGTIGTFGAAAAAARLLRLNPQQTRNALGLAAAQAAGLKSMFGTMTKPLHAGKAAMNGLLSARLALVGFTADEDAIEGIQGFVVEKGMPGFTAQEIKHKMSLRASVTSALFFDNVRVPDSSRLPNVKGLKGPLGCLTQARYGITWGPIGAAIACLDEVLAYTKERILFDRPVAATQSAQIKMAEMARRITLAQLLSLQLGRLKDAGTMAPQQVSLAKWNNCRMAIDIARECRDLLGGAGITTEHAAIRHALNLESVITYEGTETVHQLVIGRELTGINAF